MFSVFSQDKVAFAGSLIKEVVSQFETMVTKLDTGISKLIEKEKENCIKIDDLQIENNVIKSMTEDAKMTRAKIQNLIS